MQRPRSEGRVASPRVRSRITSRDAENGPRPRTQPPSRSVEGEGGADDGEVEEEEVEEDEVAYVGDEDGVAGIGAAVARRRGRTPRRPTGRVQRFVLSGPGAMQVHEARTPAAGSKRSEAFMTHLPDSPPRGYSAAAVEEERRTIFSFDATDCVEKGQEYDEEHSDSSCEAAAGHHGQDEGSRDVKKQEQDEQRPEVDESTEMMSDGPTEVDIAQDDDQEPTLAKCVVGDSISDLDFDSSYEESDDDVEEYKHLQEARVRLEQEQQERDQLRHELETYMAKLSAKCDADGEKLVEFPKNFQQIVSLMTARDIEDEGIVALAPATSTGSIGEKHKSWSQVLIQNSLSKQQAFGILDESEDGTDGENGLAAKIALKMARVRQLDGILEEKLGKNLYAGINLPTKKVKKPNESGTPSRTKMTEREDATTNRTRGLEASSAGMNFIERNKKVLENGAKTKLTREEEDRIRKLMRDAKKQECAETLPPDALKSEEFKLDPDQKEDIEKLLAEKRGAYTSAVLMALDDEGAKADGESEVVSKGFHNRKPNIFQETKNERLRRQKLQRIDEELKFLQENESVPILPNDDDDDDGCRSERSYMTTSSIFSTCSTRSGVTRRQLDQFVTAELSKPECTGEKASSDEITKLLRSLSHVSTATPRPATTTV